MSSRSMTNRTAAVMEAAYQAYGNRVKLNRSDEKQPWRHDGGLFHAGPLRKRVLVRKGGEG